MNSLPADLAYDSAALRERMIGAFSGRRHLESLFQNEDCRYGERTSSVLLLVGELPPETGKPEETCIILNKRSKEVRQPGDLCCPGGSVEKVDHLIARFLSSSSSSLSKWPVWNEMKKKQPEIAQFISLLYATGLREAWEEMGLNPFGLVFLGPLPMQCLVVYRRSVHPMAAWVSGQKDFRLSWEVERIVKFPLRALLNPFNYGLYRRYICPSLERRFSDPLHVLTSEFHLSSREHMDNVAVQSREKKGRKYSGWKTSDFPCFIYNAEGHAEILWGVTFKIVTQFLEMIFGFQVPDIDGLPVIPSTLDEEYLRR